MSSEPVSQLLSLQAEHNTNISSVVVCQYDWLELKVFTVTIAWYLVI